MRSVTCTLDLQALIGATAITRMILQRPRPPAGRPAGVDEAVRLIRSFAALLAAHDGLRSLRAGTYSMILTAGCDPCSLRSLRASDFSLCPNEGHAPVAGAFARHGIVTEAEAARRAAEMRATEPARLGSKRLVSLEQAIAVFYDAGARLSAALAANRARRDIFSLPRGAGALPPFLDLKRFTGDIPAFHDGVTSCRASRFERAARGRFGARYGAFARSLVAGRGNPGAFPLYLKVGDEVLVSHFFADLFFYALLPILHRKEFDLETARRGRAYERAVQAHFERRGFKYTPNVKVKGLHEIDGIAVSEEIAYIVEAKCWSPKPLIGDPAYLANLAQKMRGAIDGVQHERSAGKTKRRGVPLPRKVEWAGRHRDLCGIGAGAEVRGLLAVNTDPPLQEYNGCEIVLVDNTEGGCE